MEHLKPEQIEFACKAFQIWMSTCEENKRYYSEANVDHSVLLRRLLSGKELHEQPPPKRNSYPAWELVELKEGEEIEIIGLCEYDHGDGPILLIDQHDGYVWENKEDKILRYPRLKLRFQYFEKEISWNKKVNGVEKSFSSTAKFLKKLKNVQVV